MMKVRKIPVKQKKVHVSLGNRWEATAGTDLDAFGKYGITEGQFQGQ